MKLPGGMFDVVQMLYSTVQNLGEKDLNVIQHVLGTVLSGKLQNWRSFLHLTHAQKILAGVALELVEAKF